MNRMFDRIFFRNEHICPRWLCFSFDNVFRKLMQNPYKILGPYIREGDTVVDIGPGIGYFTIPLAEMVGGNGRVIAVDIQRKMLEAIKKRANRRGMRERIDFQLASSDLLGVESKADFILAFWMVHEVPDKKRFFAEVYSLLKKEGRFLMAEPKLHVSSEKFVQALDHAHEAGLTLYDNPNISLSRSAVLIKKNKE